MFAQNPASSSDQRLPVVIAPTSDLKAPTIPTVNAASEPISVAATSLPPLPSTPLSATISQRISLLRLASENDPVIFLQEFARNTATTLSHLPPVAVSHVCTSVAHALMATGRADVARDVVVWLRKLNQLAPDTGNQIDFLHLVALIEYFNGDQKLAISSIEQAIALATTHNDHARTLQTVSAYATIGQDAGLYEKIFTAVRNAKISATEPSAQRFLADYWHAHADIYTAVGDRDNAVIFYERALQAARQNGSALTQSTILQALAVVRRQQKKFDLARQLVIEALSISTRLRDTNGQIQAKVLLARLDSQTGKADQALAQYPALIKTMQTFDDQESVAFTRISYAQALIEKNQARAALEQLDLAKLELDKNPSTSKYLDYWAVRGRALRMIGNYELAATAFESALKAELESSSQNVQVRIMAQQALYRVDEAQQAKILLKKENALKREQLESSQERGRLQIGIVALTICLAAALGAFAYAQTKAARRSRQEAREDSLTKLMTRSATLEDGERAFVLARRHSHALSVLVMDLDHFKRINDSYGHAAGDSALRSLGALIRERLRNTDITGRIGGEEFLCVLPHTQLDAATRLADQLRLSFSRERPQGLPPSVTLSMSIGVAHIDTADVDFASLVRRADQALYAAKDQGRNRVVTA